jgi:hypothetical protein
LLGLRRYGILLSLGLEGRQLLRSIAPICCRSKVKSAGTKKPSHGNILNAGKGKAVPLHAMEALGGRGVIAPTHSLPQH